ncbi:transposable element Tcb1 transposase [Trichonephila clavipes]|nr:transposable element Tcb1 transposase [Trichonephila clavipes]
MTAQRAIFQQDNARPHTTRVSQDCLRTLNTLLWPARSPDLSPVEHIWDYLGWRDWHRSSLNELEARFQHIWSEMSQDIIQNLYASMPDRIASYIRAREGSTGTDLPPGPYGLPYFGYWPFIKNVNFHLDLHKMKEKYGDIFSFTSTGRLYIRLGTIKAVREAHITKSDCFEDRMSDFNL